MTKGAQVKISEQDRKKIKRLAGYGMRNQDIAFVMETSSATLKRKCRNELFIGRAKAKGVIQRSAYDMAKSQKHPALTIFWLKTQCGWKEPEPKRRDLPIDLKNATTEELKAYIDSNKTNRSGNRAKRKD